MPAFKQILWAVVLCGVTSAPHAEDFFLTRDENPLLRGFYLPLPSDLPRGGLPGFAIVVATTNTLNAEHRAGEALLIEGESDTLRLSYDASLSPDWRYRITVPVTHDSGGILDSPIDGYHRLLGLNAGNRPYYPINQLDYVYVAASGHEIRLSHAQTSLGDVSADVGRVLADAPTYTVSIWSSLKTPTGSVAALTSDGAFDTAAWLHAAWHRARWGLASELGIAQPLGDRLFGGAAHRTSVFARAALTRVLGDKWSIGAQWEGQSRRVTDSALRYLGPSAVLSTGATYRMLSGWRLSLGIMEDAAVNTAPDIVFFIGLHH